MYVDLKLLCHYRVRLTQNTKKPNKCGRIKEAFIACGVKIIFKHEWLIE